MALQNPADALGEHANSADQRRSGYLAHTLTQYARVWRFPLAVIVVLVAGLWAAVARASGPTVTEGARLLLAALLAVLAVAPVRPRVRIVLTYLSLIAWFVINLYEAQWLQVLTTNLGPGLKWLNYQTPGNDYWRFYHAAQHMYGLGGSPYGVSNAFPIPTYWLVYVLSGWGRLPIESAGTLFWALNIAILTGVVIALVRVSYRPYRSLGMADILLLGVLITSNPVIAALVLGQTIVIALGLWCLGVIIWERGNSHWRALVLAVTMVLGAMLKPPLAIFVGAFVLLACGEAVPILRRQGGPLSPAAQVGRWACAVTMGLIVFAILMPGGADWETFRRFPAVAHATQTVYGRELVFNFSLPFILLRKLESIGALSLNQWIEPVNVVLALLGSLLLALRIGRKSSGMSELASGFLLLPLVVGVFWSAYAAWFLPCLVRYGCWTIRRIIPPRDQAMVWAGLGLMQVFTSPLFLVGVILLLLTGDLAGGGAAASARSGVRS